MQEPIVGIKIGKWNVVRLATPDKVGRKRWVCICECGRDALVGDYQLKTGRSNSCGRHQVKRKKDRTAVRPCLNCGNEYRLPICRLKRLAYCSAPCRESAKIKISEARKRVCVVCNGYFYPRSTQIRDGQGKVCSVACRAEHAKTGLIAEIWRINSALGRANGKKGLSGYNNPRWLGGAKASYERCLKDGRKRNSMVKYRLANPQKVRDWQQSRRGRKTGRLPSGTVAGILKMQGWKCAICKVKLCKYHVDHIIPLARGGEHIAVNIQVLCPTCNVRKGAKDPIKFMQELGFLL